MLLPFLAWAATGAIFFLKPGYGGAYESLAVRTYPLETNVTFPADPSWLEARYVMTALGGHLLVRTASGWQQLDPNTFQRRPAPSEQDVRTLLADAFSANPSRYGHVLTIDGNVATTDTGVQVTLNWDRLALSQRGRDTDRIDSIYRIHYLQWTGISSVDRILGASGLVLILVLTGVGVKLLLRR
jgi:hypothetical protein